MDPLKASIPGQTLLVYILISLTQYKKNKIRWKICSSNDKKRAIILKKLRLDEFSNRKNFKIQTNSFKYFLNKYYETSQDESSIMS